MSSVPFTPFSIGSVPFVGGLLLLISLALVTPFLPEIDLDRDAADLVCVGRSFLLLELCESDLGFSPLAEEDVSDLLDRKLRLSAGIVFESFAELRTGLLQSLIETQGWKTGAGTIRNDLGFNNSIQMHWIVVGGQAL